jgi:hypothetical protein
MFFGNASQVDGEDLLLRNNERFPTLEILPFLLNEFSNLMVQDKIDRSVLDMGLDIGPKLFEGLYFSGKVSYDQETKKIKIY